MSGFGLAGERLAAAVEAALDAVAERLVQALPVDAGVEAAMGRRLVRLHDERAVQREFGTAARPPDPFLVPLLAEAERELAAHVTEALHLEP